MSIDDTVFTLKEILLDAARYRWLRDENAKCVDEDNPAMTLYVGQENGVEDFGWIGADLDLFVDQELAKL